MSDTLNIRKGSSLPNVSTQSPKLMNSYMVPLCTWGLELLNPSLEAFLPSPALFL